MRVSIVTPSFRGSEWLRLCIASVADQKGVEFEHIVQDSCSDDGTQDWLPFDKRVRAFIEKDKGMYDAVNRGFDRATGDILSYLNCDEQYLPGALRAVKECFERHPDTDVVLGDSIVTDIEGEYTCHRLSLAPGALGMWVRFPVLTSGLFVHSRVVKQAGVRLNTDWRDLGDWVWVMDMVKRGMKFRVLPMFTSVFTDTGENMNLKPNAVRERGKKWEMAPAAAKVLKLPLIVAYRLRLAVRSPLFQGPFDYSLYTRKSPNCRVTCRAARPTSFWKRRPSI